MEEALDMDKLHKLITIITGRSKGEEKQNINIHLPVQYDGK